MTQIIEQQLTGIDNLDYFSASSGSDGSASLNLTFKPGTDPDIAQMQVQNKVAAGDAAPAQRRGAAGRDGGEVERRLPDGGRAAVERSGDRPRRAERPARLATCSTRSRACPASATRSCSAAEYAMHIWLDPDKLHALRPVGERRCCRRCAGRTCSSPPARSAASRRRETQMFTATVSAEGRFTTPEQFEQILLRTNADGAAVRLKDVARVEISGAAQRLRPAVERQARGRLRGACSRRARTRSPSPPR